MKKPLKKIRSALAASVAVICIGAAPLQSSYTVSSDYTVGIHGTSNLHSWDETVSHVTGNGMVNWNSDGSFDLEAITIKMDVHSIKSDMGAAMNNNTYKALKGDANPEIIFTLSAPVTAVKAAAIETVFPAKGTLTIAGVTKPIDIKVKVYMQGKSKLIFEGSQTIKMTDYGVNPPTALFGTLKTGNEITISFKTILQSNQVL